MMLIGSWYTSRAFNPPDQGGQPKDFPLGIMKFPSIPGAACNECRTLSVGGSYVANAATKHPKQAIAFLNSFANPDAAARWLENVLVQTGIKADYAKVSGPHAGYFKELRRDQRRRQVLLRHAGAGDAGQAEGSVHAGLQQRLPGRQHQRRRRR